MQVEEVGLNGESTLFYQGGLLVLLKIVLGCGETDQPLLLGILLN